MSTSFIAERTRYTERYGTRSGGGPSYAIKTLRCALCDTPRAEFPAESLARHLARDCPAGGAE